MAEKSMTRGEAAERLAEEIASVQAALAELQETITSVEQTSPGATGSDMELQQVYRELMASVTGVHRRVQVMTQTFALWTALVEKHYLESYSGLMGLRDMLCEDRSPR